MPGDSHIDHPRAGMLPAGVVLVVGPADRRPAAVAAVERLGVFAAEFDDPYAAMARLCRRSGETAAVLLSLHGLFREELQIVAAAKRYHPHVQVWLTDIDARPAALAEAMRLGADGLLGEDGLHQVGGADPGRGTQSPRQQVPAARDARPFFAAGDRDGPAGRPAADDDEMFPTLGGSPRIERVAGSVGGVPDRGDPDDDDADGLDPFAADHRSARADEDDAPYAQSSGEPLLSADELRALLHDHPDTLPLSRDER